jgi:hypothetical protein
MGARKLHGTGPVIEPDAGLKIHPATETDSEGHGIRVHPFAEPDETVRVHPATEPDDTEGHRRNFH